LHVERQPFLGAPADDVQMAAHRPQEILSLLKLAQLVRGHQPLVDQFGDRSDPVEVFADPEQCMQVAQPALALFQIRLDDIAAVAHPFVPRFTFGEFFGNECARRARDDIAREPRRRFVIDRAVAPHIACFEQRRADRQVALGQLHHFVDRAR